MTKQESARILYFQGFELREIANIVNTSYNTISKWSSTLNWKQKKSEKLLREETSQERIWKLIEYQLKVIEKITNTRMIELDNVNDVDGLSKLLISKGDIDALQKLFTTIKGKEVTWDQIVKSARELLEHIAENDLTIAKKVTPIVEDWLNLKRETL
jgi:hypothetical protein